ncbi:MAG: phenylphosphate carboxylase subunit delta [Phycisphaerales bacterium]|nr:phenylphosphate carboxylase subunit delta [Phycisphaerales bacterium]
MAANPSEITVLVLDVDGVLTDGSITLNDHGVESKRFHVRDGAGLRIWRRLGGRVAAVTGRSGLALRHRANELGFDLVESGVRDKREAFGQVLERLECDAGSVAVVGDDLPDLSMLRLCGYPIAVADACHEVREMAAYVTCCPGGSGAVRDAIEHILKAQGRWGEALAVFEAAS